MFQISLRGVRSFQSKVGKIDRYLGNLKAEVEVTANKLHKMFARNFRQGGPRGSPWQPLADATEDMRDEPAGYYEGTAPCSRPGILVWGGSLLASLTGSGPHAVKRVQHGCIELWLGSRHPLALLHHKGSVHGRPPIKVRTARSLSMFVGGGSVEFRGGAGPAVINIPARPFYDPKEVEEITKGQGKRILNEVFKIWDSH